MIRILCALTALCLLAGCASQAPLQMQRSPDDVRAEILRNIENPEARDVTRGKIGRLLPNMDDIKRCIAPVLRVAIARFEQEALLRRQLVEALRQHLIAAPERPAYYPGAALATGLAWGVATAKAADNTALSCF